MKHFGWVAVCVLLGILLGLTDWNKFPLKNKTFRCLRRSFSWLRKEYGFSETKYQSSGSWYFIVFKNEEWEIKVIFDLRLSEPPLTVRIYRADHWGLPYDSRIWERQYDRKVCSDKAMIEDTARWLRDLISTGEIAYTK